MKTPNNNNSPRSTAGSASCLHRSSAAIKITSSSVEDELAPILARDLELDESDCNLPTIKHHGASNKKEHHLQESAEVTTTSLHKDPRETATTLSLAKLKRQHETDCYRHAIVDVPVLMELLNLIGCPICGEALQYDKVRRDDQTSVVDLTLRCVQRDCAFIKHWCSSPTAGINI